jgi:hypothetical protein
MPIPTIAVYTHTGLLPANLIEAWVVAAQIALTRDFAPHWSDAKLVYVPPGGTIAPDWWQLVYFDHSDQAGALGYHDVTPAGMPLGKVFIQDCLDDKENWNVTSSHEIHEMIVDPSINLTVTVKGSDGITRQYAKEPDDASEDDHYAPRIGGHLQSNSVTPAWFDPNGKPPYTIYPCPDITAPLMLAPGGYIGWREVAPAAGEWQQQFARIAGPRQVKKPSSRTMRRFARDLVLPAAAP